MSVHNRSRGLLPLNFRYWSPASQNQAVRLLRSEERQLSQMAGLVMRSPQVPAIRPNEVLLLTGAHCTPAPHLVQQRSKTSMSSALLIIEVAAPLLALVSLLGIAWVRRQDRRIRRQALSIQRRLDVDLDGLDREGRRIRQRIVLVAEAYCRANANNREKLTRGIDELLTDVERLRGDLHVVASRLEEARRGGLREAYDHLRSMVIECRELGRDLEERDRLWGRQLGDMTSLSKTAHETSGTRKMVLT